MVFELKKREENGEVPKLIDDFEDPWFKKEAPAVGAVLFAASFPDGTVRESGYLSVWRGAEGITVKLTDDHIKSCWQFTSETFHKALGLVEKALQTGKPGNRSMMARASSKKKKTT